MASASLLWVLLNQTRNSAFDVAVVITGDGTVKTILKVGEPRLEASGGTSHRHLFWVTVSEYSRSFPTTTKLVNFLILMFEKEAQP